MSVALTGVACAQEPTPETQPDETRVAVSAAKTVVEFQFTTSPALAYCANAEVDLTPAVCVITDCSTGSQVEATPVTEAAPFSCIPQSVTKTGAIHYPDTKKCQALLRINAPPLRC